MPNQRHYCWKCGAELPGIGDACPRCAARPTDRRPVPAGDPEARALRQIYDHYGPDQTLRHHTLLPNAVGDVLGEDAKALRIQLRTALDAGLGKLYRDELTHPAPNFSAQAMRLLEENGLSHKASQRLIELFDDMTGLPRHAVAPAPTVPATAAAAPRRGKALPVVILLLIAALALGGFFAHRAGLLFPAADGPVIDAVTAPALTEAPTEQPTDEPTEAPTEAPTAEPTDEPTDVPTDEPTEAPTDESTDVPAPVVPAALTVPEPITPQTPVAAPDSATARVLRSDFAFGDSVSFTDHTFGSDIPRSAVRSIAFRDTLSGAPDSAWDASADGDGTVLAWALPSADTDDSGNPLYTLIVAADGPVRLPENSKCLFASFTNLIGIDFAGCVDTFAVTDMSWMFRNCPQVVSLDLSSFDTSAVTNTSSMFFGCFQLQSLNLSSFDTAAVTDMSFMLSSCWQLQAVDLSSFDTAAVNTMEGMFGDCPALERVTVSERFVLPDDFSADDVLGGSAVDAFTVIPPRTLLNDAGDFASAEQFTFGRAFPRATVRSIAFRDTLDGAPSDAWDASATRDRSVLAWLTPTDAADLDGNPLWDLTVAANGPVRFPEDSSLLFRQFTHVVSIDFGRAVDTSATRDMTAMFSHCELLPALDLTGFDTSAVAGMSWMFSNCQGLESLDLSSFDTSAVVDMQYMFNNCASLAALDLSRFDTSAVVDMQYMFNACASLTALDVSSFDTSSVANMSHMFVCKSLTALDVSRFDTSAVTDMSWMFSGSAALTTLDLTSFDVSSAADLSYMFYYCDSLRQVTVSDRFAIREGANTYAMFTGAPAEALTVIDPATVRVLYNDYAHVGRPIIGDEDWTLDLFHSNNPRSAIRTITFRDTLDGMPSRAWDASESGDGSVRAWLIATSAADGSGSFLYDLVIAADGPVRLPANAQALFARFPNLTAIDFAGCVDTSAVTSMAHMFYRCPSLTALDLSGFDTSSVTDMSWMFYRCGLTTLDLSGFDTSSVANMALMFQYCDRLTSLNLSAFDTSAVTDMSWMFAYCINLRQVTVSNRFIIPDDADATGMLAGSGLSGLEAFTVLDPMNARVLYNDYTHAQSANPENDGWLLLRLFGREYARAAIRTITFRDTLDGAPPDVWDASENGDGSVLAWLIATDAVDDLDHPLYDLVIAADGPVRLPANASFLFFAFENLTGVNFAGCVDTSSVTGMRGMFMFSTALTELDLSGFDTSSVTDMSGLFQGCLSLTTLDLSGLDTSAVTDMSAMFYACPALTALDLSAFDTSSVTTAAMMFMHCYGLEEVLVSEDFFLGPNVNTQDMFYDNPHITNLSDFTLATDAPGASVPPVTGGTRTLYNDVQAGSDPTGVRAFHSDVPRSSVRSITFRRGLSGLPADAWDASANGDGTVWAWVSDAGDGLLALTLAADGPIRLTGDCQYLFAFFTSLEQLDFAGCADTAGLTSMAHMFDRCVSLPSLDLTGFDTSAVTSMAGVFSGCRALTALNLSSFDTARVTNMNAAFQGCASLVTLDLTAFDTSAVTDMYNMFADCASLSDVTVTSLFVRPADVADSNILLGSPLQSLADFTLVD